MPKPVSDPPSTSAATEIAWPVGASGGTPAPGSPGCSGSCTISSLTVTKSVKSTRCSRCAAVEAGSSSIPTVSTTGPLGRALVARATAECRSRAPRVSVWPATPLTATVTSRWSSKPVAASADVAVMSSGPSTALVWVMR